MQPDVSKTETIDLADIRAFCAVADHGSITRAARTTGETKGSVSRRVTRLERALGVALLRRSPRLVRTTEDGAAYRARMARVLELLDEANTAVRPGQAEPGGTLRVTAPMDIAASVLAPTLTRFRQQYPAVRVEMLLTDAVLDLDAHLVDVALRVAAQLPDSTLVAHRLADLGAALYASPDYLSGHPPPRTPGDLTGHGILTRATRDPGRLALTRGTEPAGEVRVNPVLTCNEFFFLQQSALAGGGIAVLPSVLATPHVDAGRLVRVLPDYALPGASFYLLYPGSRLLTPKVRAFRDFMRAAFQEGGAVAGAHRG